MKRRNLSRAPVKVLDSMPMLIVCIVVIFFLYIACLTKMLSTNAMRYIVLIALYTTMAQMWNLLSGFSGMTSLGQQLYIGLAGYTIAVTATIFHLPLGLGLLASVAVSLVVSLLMALILFRMEGMYFSIATWVVAEAFAMIFLNWKFVKQGAGLTIHVVPYPRLHEIYLLAVTVCVLALVTVYLLMHTKVGLGLTAMRDDITAAASIGVNIFSHKLLVYVIAAVFTAISGAIIFINKGTIYPESGYSISWMVSVIFIVIIGGTGTISGPIVGALIYVFLEEYLAHYPGWSNIILGVITILVIIFLPDGIMGTLQRRFNFEIFSAKRFSYTKHKG